MARQSCPDTGACHHDCTERCFRVDYCEPLTAAGWGEEWPESVKANPRPRPIPVVVTDEMPRERCLLISAQEIPMEFVARMHPEPIEEGDELVFAVRYQVAFSDEEKIRGNVVAVKLHA